MNQPPEPKEQETPRASVTGVKKRAHISPIWFIPLLVSLVVVYVVVTEVKRRGTTVTVSFSSADGLVPGETPIKHKNVRLGTVEDVHLSDDLKRVEVKLRVERHEEAILTDHARFWIVRPRFSGSVSNLAAGLQTIVSGAYISVDPGPPGGAQKTTFVGLEEPPGVRSDEPGKNFIIKAERLGSLGQGSPIYFRDAVVGEVLKWDVGTGSEPATLSIFVHGPYDKLVATNTHFWSVSGLAINTGPEGLRVEVQSLQAVIAGGISFDVPRSMPLGPPAPDGAAFKLYDDEHASEAATYSAGIPCVTYFNSSVQGLAADSAVTLLGSTVGLVRDVRIVNDPKHEGAWLARVAFEIQPERIQPPAVPMTAESLRAHPARVTLDSTSFLTGQKVLTLDFDASRAPKASDIQVEGTSVVLPGESGGLDNVTTALGHVAGKLEQIPFDEIGRNANDTLRAVRDTVGGDQLKDAIAQMQATMAEVQKLVKDADSGLGPALARVPAIADQLQEAIAHANHAFGESGYGADSDFQRNAARLMVQMSEAARSIRLLADYLDRHPEALLRGRSNGSEK